jgi:hypothetical protein
LNQLFVAESFQALHLERGRSILSRDDLQARHDLCEDTAQSLAEVCLSLHARTDIQIADAIKQCHDGLLNPPSPVTQAEARCVAIRVAELLACDVPESLADTP